MTANKQVRQFLQTLHLFSYLTIALYLTTNFFSIEWHQIFSFNGVLIVIAILAMLYLLYRTAPKDVGFDRVFWILFMTGGLAFLVLLWAARELGLYAVTSTFHNYKGIVTRRSNKTTTIYTRRQRYTRVHRAHMVTT